jgi:hypothetical protein
MPTTDGFSLLGRAVPPQWCTNCTRCWSRRVGSSRSAIEAPDSGPARGGAWQVVGRPEHGAGAQRSAYHEPRSRAGACDRKTATGPGPSAAGITQAQIPWTNALN